MFSAGSMTTMIRYGIPLPIDEAWANKADLLLSLGRHNEGLRCAERALTQNKSIALGWYCKGACTAALGDRKAAHFLLR